MEYVYILYIPSGELTYQWKMAIYSGNSHNSHNSHLGLSENVGLIFPMK